MKFSSSQSFFFISLFQNRCKQRNQLNQRDIMTLVLNATQYASSNGKQVIKTLKTFSKKPFYNRLVASDEIS
jgi:hypothetical protein